MIYIRPILEKYNKKASEFIAWLCDERKEHNLYEYKNKNIIKIERNGGGGSEIHIDEVLENKLNEFIDTK